MDQLALRIAEQERFAQARAAAVRARLPVGVAWLRAQGAEQVWVFGSMAAGGRPHAGSDVDIAVKGIPAARLLRAVVELEDILGTRVDLVRFEEMGESLRQRVIEEGEAVFVSS